MYNITTGTHAAIHHLRQRHGTLFGRGATEEEASTSTGTIDAAFQTAAKVINNVVTSLDVSRFRWYLIRWIVCAHIALSCVEDENFRALILLLAPALEVYHVASGNTIR